MNQRIQKKVRPHSAGAEGRDLEQRCYLQWPQRESSKIWKEVSGKEKNRSQGPCTTKVMVHSLLHLMIQITVRETLTSSGHIIYTLSHISSKRSSTSELNIYLIIYDIHFVQFQSIY